MLTGQNGILNRASDAKEKTEESSKDEQRKLAQAEALMSTGKTTYKGLTLPEGFAPTKIEGEDSIDDGLVITDGYGNEYVWVEVPRTETVYPTATINITEFDENAYTKIENDLHTYTEAYRNDTNYNDTYVKDTATGWFKNATEYNEAKQKMLKSVYQNSGFWVGRYESGTEVNRTTSETVTTMPLSKENLYPYTYIKRTQAKVLAEQVESGSYTSSLMFGVQWDLVLKYIETKNATTQYNLKTNSTTIGNYYNSEFTLNRGKFAQYNVLSSWYNFDSKDKSDLVIGNRKKLQSSYEKGILLTTGATEATKLQNIYDMAGNVWEWTLEKTSRDDGPCTVRGGNFRYDGLECSASSRDSTVTSGSHSGIGFRISLY